MSNISSGGSNDLSVLKSPVPYLLGGVAAMLVLIVIALIILAWSYFQKSSGDWEHRENNRADQDNFELGDGHNNDMTKDMPNLSDEKDETRVIVIMAGHDKPTFLAKPTSVAVEV